MPWYRIPGLPSAVHVKGTKLPAPCAARILIGGKDVPCMDISAFLCDGPSQAPRTDTCDMPLCRAHATQVGPDKHLCPRCRTEAIDAAGQRGLFTSLVQS